MPRKNSDKSPGEKLLSLYTFFMLKGDKHSSLGELAQILDCSKQTVLRLLAQLESSGYGKLEEPLRQGREHFYRMAAKPQTRLDLGVTELAQLALCRNMLLSILPNGISQLMRDQTDTGETPEDSLSIVYTKGRIDYAPFQKQYNTLMQALRQKRVCHLEYQKHPAKPARQFCFAPLRVISYHESISFLGWEVTDSGRVEALFSKPLFLYLQRCRNARLTQRSSAKLPPDREKSGDAFGIMEGETFDASLLFEPEAVPYVHDRQWSAGQRMELREDGRLLLNLKVASKPEIISWVLSFGGNAHVIKPEWLREEVASQAQKILEYYSSPANSPQTS